ncbi:hypothetical protein [Flavobacterium panacagri]|uniref:hypothetical protein n=1 Tax=Flavobacterium panacagri TaxID=3034146 RepID=UPI0025A5EE95|nr:hypothetical protein [Flavobacterium panacagri]
MKKILAFFLMTALLSCSNEDQTIQSAEGLSANSLSVLDGTTLSFKDDKSFITEYNELTKLKTGEELQAWISKKKHSSLLNAINESVIDQEETLEDTEVSKYIYSNALSAIFNEDSKVKINGKTLWLNEQNLYELSSVDLNKTSEQLQVERSNLKIYGNVFGETKNNETGRSIINANKSKSWEYGFNWDGRERKIILTLFNETIYLNGDVYTTKMFLRAQRLGRYCSVWRCRWNSDAGGVVMVRFTGYTNWPINPIFVEYYSYQLNDNANTIMLADGSRYSGTPVMLPGPADYFAVSGTVTCSFTNVPAIQFQPAATTWTQDISWF